MEVRSPVQCNTLGFSVLHSLAAIDLQYLGRELEKRGISIYQYLQRLNVIAQTFFLERLSAIVTDFPTLI